MTSTQRNLQGRDPSLYEMILKMSTVQRRLIKKSETLVAKEVELRELERVNGELKKQLIRRPGPDAGERLNRSRDAIKAKSRQIKVSRPIDRGLGKGGGQWGHAPPRKFPC